MIIIPEIETIVILVPRCGSTALKNALLVKYPLATMLYRHMEADGVPYGYTHWRKIGVIRPPLARLWSLYNYCRSLDKEHPHWSPGRAAKTREATQAPFAEWLITNTFIFATAGPNARGELIPRYTTLHPLPENFKSQRIYLRPDLGTEIWQYKKLPELGAVLGVDLRKENSAPYDQLPPHGELPALPHLQWDATVAGGWW